MSVLKHYSVKMLLNIINETQTILLYLTSNFDYKYQYISFFIIFFSISCCVATNVISLKYRFPFCQDWMISNTSISIKYFYIKFSQINVFYMNFGEEQWLKILSSNHERISWSS